MMLKRDRPCTDSTMDVVFFRYGAKLRKFECGNHYWKVMCGWARYEAWNAPLKPSKISLSSLTRSRALVTYDDKRVAVTSFRNTWSSSVTIPVNGGQISWWIECSIATLEGKNSVPLSTAMPIEWALLGAWLESSNHPSTPINPDTASPCGLRPRSGKAKKVLSRAQRHQSASHWPLGRVPRLYLDSFFLFFLFPHLILSYLGRTSDDCPVGDRHSAWRRRFGKLVRPGRIQMDFIFIYYFSSV